jgi:hybrid cluster-associated redox disulfide protein
MTTVVAWGALVVAVLAVGYAWKLSHELATATRRLDRYNKALFATNDELRTLRERTEEELARLRVQIRRGGPAAGFSPEMTVRDALLMHPQAEQVLAGLHLGGCSHCAVEPDETLAQVCAQHGVELVQVVGQLNLLLGGAPATGVAVNGSAPQPVKLPNVAFEF